MKSVRMVLLFTVVVVVCSAFSFTKRSNTVYAFGFSDSFMDTVVYCTELQILDSVRLDNNGFLPYREHYSYQLKNYLEYEKGMKDRVCMIYFSDDKAKLTRTLNNLLLKYKKDKTIRVQEVKLSEFSFKKPED